MRTNTLMLLVIVLGKLHIQSQIWLLMASKRKMILKQDVSAFRLKDVN
jgi:hypothetical protein